MRLAALAGDFKAQHGRRHTDIKRLSAAGHRDTDQAVKVTAQLVQG